MNKKGFLSNFIGLIAFIVSIVIYAILLPVLSTIINTTLAGLSGYPIASFIILIFPFIILLMVVYRGLQLVVGGVSL